MIERRVEKKVAFVKDCLKSLLLGLDIRGDIEDFLTKITPAGCFKAGNSYQALAFDNFRKGEEVTIEALLRHRRDVTAEDYQHIQIFRELRKRLPLDVVVVTHSAYGMCITADAAVLIIYVNPLLSPKEMLYTLAHEIGHRFYPAKSKTHLLRLNRADSNSDEKTANLRAISMLNHLGLTSFEDDFMSFYDEIVEKNKQIKLWV